ncbi:MAG: hypothetical protein J5654_07625 [Victivallales bacterium]|nr:hypothetical protein [Victivallales bacterium]
MKPILYTLCLILALFSVCNVPAASYDTNSYPHLRDRNEKRIKEITKFIAAEAKKQQDAWFLAKQAQDQAKAGGNNDGFGGPGPSMKPMGPGMGPGGMPPAPSPANDLPPVPDKFEINEELIQAAVTAKFGGDLMDAAGPFPKVDIRSKLELQEAAAKLPEIKENFADSFEMEYAIQPLRREEAMKVQELLKDALIPEIRLLQLQFQNKAGKWVEWTMKNAEPNAHEWRVAIRMKPVTPEAVQKIEYALAEIEYPLYHENASVEISFSPTEKVARRTFSGAFKRIGRFKLSIGKDILGLDDLPEKLRARFDPELNRRAREQFLDRHPVFSRLNLERQEMIDAKTKEMLCRQFEQNLPRGWIFIGDSWKVPADMVHDVLVFRRQHDAATREMFKKQAQKRARDEQEQQNQGQGGPGGYRR